MGLQVKLFQQQLLFLPEWVTVNVVEGVVKWTCVILYGSKCGTVIPGIISSRKSSSSDSSTFLCVGDIDLCYVTIVNFSLSCRVAVVFEKFVVTVMQLVPFIDSVESSHVNLLRFHCFISRGSHICVYGGFTVGKNGYSGGITGN
ncbi:MAG: hypothetical protein EZS28_006840 [Streblomastix strix]|uniref:Uncharacterized protein n=1 Tax=Streblomastix strix TaxID=222440 RepID=A0A5J4WRT7_9EUKA|nr:MAG: hypothetical protein EZS28_006840 [Streblomastix strix]